jgi:hypothetical protein
MIVKRGDKFEVRTSDGKRVLGTHATRKGAENQLAAIEWSKSQRMASGGPVLGPSAEGEWIGEQIDRRPRSVEEAIANARQNAGPMLRGLETGLVGPGLDAVRAGVGALGDAYGAWDAAPEALVEGYRRRMAEAAVREEALRRQSPAAYAFGEKLPERVSDAAGIVGAAGHVRLPELPRVGPGAAPELAFARAGREAPVARMPEAAPRPIARAGEPIEFEQAAYSGSRNVYDKTDLEHVGSGEGTLDEGWGHYATRDPRVGDWYRRAYLPAEANDRGGSLHKLEVPENTELLNWDMPISQQPPAIKAALKRATLLSKDGKTIKGIGSKDVPASEMTGEALYDALTRSFGGQRRPGAGMERIGKESVDAMRMASRRLGQAGIKGHTFIGTDPHSRKPVQNFVLWDRAAIEDRAAAEDLASLAKKIEPEPLAHGGQVQRMAAGGDPEASTIYMPLEPGQSVQPAEEPPPPLPATKEPVIDQQRLANAEQFFKQTAVDLLRNKAQKVLQAEEPPPIVPGPEATHPWTAAHPPPFTPGPSATHPWTAAHPAPESTKPPAAQPPPGGLEGAFERGSETEAERAQRETEQDIEKKAQIARAEQEQRAANLQRQEEERQQLQRDYQAQLAANAKAQQELAAQEPDRNRWWSQKSVANKIGSAIALLVGGFAAGAGGHKNKALELVEREIDNDVQSQVNRKNSLVDFYVKRGNEIQAAQRLAAADLAESAANQMEQLKASTAAQMVSPDTDLAIKGLRAQAAAARQQAAISGAELKLKAAKTYAEVGKLNAETAQAYAGARKAARESVGIQYGVAVPTAQLGKIPEGEREKYVNVGGGMWLPATGKEQAKKAETNLSTARDMFETVNELDRFMKMGNLVLGTSEYSEALSTAKSLMGPLRASMGLGVLNQSDIELLDAIIPNPAQLFTLNATNVGKLNRLRKMANKVHAAGMHLLGSEPPASEAR